MATAAQVLSPAPRRWLHWTPEMDSEVRAAYLNYVTHHDRKSTTRAAERLGLPRWRITHRAVELGLARAKEKPWANAELQLLRENMHYGLAEISRRLRVAGYVRSPAAVGLKRKRLKLTTRHNQTGYTKNALAGLLGIDRGSLDPWIEKGLLPAERRLTLRVDAQGGDGYWIRRSDFRAFVFQFPELIDVRKVDGFWFINLLRGEEMADGAAEEHF